MGVGRRLIVDHFISKLSLPGGVAKIVNNNWLLLLVLSEAIFQTSDFQLFEGARLVSKSLKKMDFGYDGESVLWLKSLKKIEVLKKSSE